MPKKKMAFTEKFEAVGNEWKAKPKGGGWQTRPGSKIVLPNGRNGELAPWIENMRLWAFEMNQWAKKVTQEMHELRNEVEALKKGRRAVA